MTQDELCGHLEQVKRDLEQAYNYRDWPMVDRAYSRLAELTTQLRRADSFTIEGTWPL